MPIKNNHKAPNKLISLSEGSCPMQPSKSAEETLSPGGVNLMLCIPMIWVKKLRTSASWFNEVLGFSSVYEQKDDEGQPVMIHMRKGLNQDLLLAPDPPGFTARRQERGLGMTLAFIVDEDIDELASEVWSCGGEIVSPPTDQASNIRDVVIRDPNGYLIRLSRLANARPVGELIRMAKCCGE